MLIGSILIGVALLLIILPFVFSPLQRSAHIPLYKPLANESQHPARRSDTLRALRDLEFDYMTGKVADEDYQTLRLELMKQAAASETADNIDVEIEAAVRSLRQHRRQQAPGATCDVCGAQLHSGNRFCPSCGAPITDKKICVACGQHYQPQDKFCPHCGIPVSGILEAVAVSGDTPHNG